MDGIFCCLIFFDFSILHRFFIGCDIFLLFEMSILDRISLSSRAILLVVHIVLWFCNVFLFFLSIKLYHLLWEGVRVFFRKDCIFGDVLLNVLSMMMVSLYKAMVLCFVKEQFVFCLFLFAVNSVCLHIELICLLMLFRVLFFSGRRIAESVILFLSYVDVWLLLWTIRIDLQELSLLWFM